MGAAAAAVGTQGCTWDGRAARTLYRPGKGQWWAGDKSPGSPHSSWYLYTHIHTPPPHYFTGIGKFAESDKVKIYWTAKSCSTKADAYG